MKLIHLSDLHIGKRVNEFSMLEETFAFMEFYTATDDMEKMQKINRGFEAIIYNACHNREMESLLLRYDFLSVTRTRT